jgi:hypothetical protein
MLRGRVHLQRMIFRSSYHVFQRALDNFQNLHK